jgi:hypothetical protein
MPSPYMIKQIGSISSGLGWPGGGGGSCIETGVTRPLGIGRMITKEGMVGFIDRGGNESEPRLGVDRSIAWEPVNG